MAFIGRSFEKINKELRYGVIYVVTSLSRYSDEHINSGGWLSPRMLEWLRRLTGYDIEVVELPMAQGTKLVARRINVGNAGKDAVVEMPLRYESFKDIERFVKSATDVFSTDEGNQVLEQEEDLDSKKDYHIDYSKEVESTINELVKKKVSELNKRKIKKGLSLTRAQKECVSCDSFMRSAPEPIARADVELEEEEELLTIEKQKQDALKAIQAQILDFVTTYHTDPAHLIEVLIQGKFVINKDSRLSPLVVNNDMKIVLPNYNEVEVEMPAMCRAIYILFLKHPEGIALRNIGDHRAELENIYSIVMPGRSEEKAKEAIDNLVNPMSNTLNEYISKIKRCFKSCIIDEKLANNYCITGKRGEPYGIALDPSLITLPRAVKDE